MIKVRDIHRSFDKLQVLKGIDLNIAQGEIVSIVGPSGAGKTTLLQIIGSLDKPDKGSVEINSTDIFSLSSSQLSKFRNLNIGFIFQFHQLLPEFSLLENVAMPALIAGKGKTESYIRAQNLIEYLGLKERMGHKPAQLSGGERQRAAVARALVNDPKVILADEPSGSLDSHNRNELHQLFFDLRSDMGYTFIIVTHDDELAGLADRKISMVDGKIINITQRTLQQKPLTTPLP